MTFCYHSTGENDVFVASLLTDVVVLSPLSFYAVAYLLVGTHVGKVDSWKDDT